MPIKFEWQEQGSGGAVLHTEALILYVEPMPGGFLYRVGGQYQLRCSLKPIPTLAEAKAKCIKAATNVLRSEIDSLATVEESPLPLHTKET